ncbi:MAG: hypothetical protein WD227_14660 [Vicinamibacterales bacterium]
MLSTPQKPGSPKRSGLPADPTAEKDPKLLADAAWRGNSLVMKTTATLAGATTQIIRVWTLDAENQLLVEATTAVDTPQMRTVKAVYKRK